EKQWQVWLGVVVRAAAEVGVLADDGVAADADLVEVVDHDPFGQRAALADAELPRVEDAHAGSDEGMAPDAGAEAAEHPSPPAERARRAPAEERRPDHSPQR